MRGFASNQLKAEVLAYAAAQWFPPGSLGGANVHRDTCGRERTGHVDFTTVRVRPHKPEWIDENATHRIVLLENRVNLRLGPTAAPGAQLVGDVPGARHQVVFSGPPHLVPPISFPVIIFVAGHVDFESFYDARTAQQLAAAPGVATSNFADCGWQTAYAMLVARLVARVTAGGVGCAQISPCLQY